MFRFGEKRPPYLCHYTLLVACKLVVGGIHGYLLSKELLSIRSFSDERYPWTLPIILCLPWTKLWSPDLPYDEQRQYCIFLIEIRLFLNKDTKCWRIEFVD